MKELSLNILDIAQNSVKAGATEISIELTETETELTIVITDNGCGMKPEFLSNVTDPFTTSRTTRNVGLGIPFFKLSAEQTGGYFEISSKHKDEFPETHGTKTLAHYKKNHIDFTPLGDVISSITVLLQGAPEIHWIYSHILPDRSVLLDTEEIKAVLGDIPISAPEIISWIGEYLREQYTGEEK